MYQGIRPYVPPVSTGGSRVIAVPPVTVPPPDVHAAPLPVAQRVVTLPEVQLASLSEDLTGVVGQLVSPVPGDLDEYDFLDAAVVTGQNLAFQTFRLVALSPLVVVLLAAGAPPDDLALVVVNSYLRLPLDLTKPWVAALANILPAPLGCVPDEDSSVPGQGILMDTWHSADDALTGLVTGIFQPNQQLAGRQALAKDP